MPERSAAMPMRDGIGRVSSHHKITPTGANTVSGVRL
jgi:hypothetical protein